MTIQTSKLHSVSLTLLRLLLAAWIGAAVLFVITSVAEQTSEHFGSRTRDQLAAIRFPHYYAFGFAVHALTLVLALIVRISKACRSPRLFSVVIAFIAASCLGIALDYFMVYQPLLSSITPPGQARTTEFIRLHNLSRYANQAHLSLMLVAAILATIPLKPSPRDQDA